MKNNIDGSDINVGSIEEELKVGDKVKLKSKHIGTIVNINEFREPSMKYGIDIKGFNDIAFLGEEAILRKIEKQNNIDEDIENKIKKEDKIKNIIARAKEINDKSKESNSESSLEGCLAIDILNLGKELETYKKMINRISNMTVVLDEGATLKGKFIIDLVRQEIENGKI